MLQRLDKAFTAFFRRPKAGAKPGYPRFRGVGRYVSLTYPQYGNGAKLVGSDLPLSKVGVVAVVLHRPLDGTPKTVTVGLSPTGKWYASVACAGEPTTLALVEPVIGIDLGLASFATFSNGEQIANPRFFRKEAQALAHIQRQHAQLGRGSQRRHQHRKVVARVHERVKFRRADFVHQQGRRIVHTHQVIAVEDLTVTEMMPNHGLAKSIHDAAWTSFSAWLRVKAAWAARRFSAVNPAYTSQDCSRCGHRQKMPLDERVYRCPCCGLVRDRDPNAALNILGLGLQPSGNQSVEAPAFTPGE